MKVAAFAGSLNKSCCALLEVCPHYLVSVLYAHCHNSSWVTKTITMIYSLDNDTKPLT